MYSEYALYTTGCGLPAGPGGSLGAIEGIGYLTLAIVLTWSFATKIRTGRGLPEGPGGLLATTEGFAYLLLAGGIFSAVAAIITHGGLPTGVAEAGSQCAPL